MGSGIPPVRALTSNGYRLLDLIAGRSPEMFTAGDPDALKAEMERRRDRDAKLFDAHRVWHQQTPLESIDDSAKPGPGMDAEHARMLRAALPALTAADASDPLVLASINCFHLAGYTPVRWSLSKHSPKPDRSVSHDDSVEFVRTHWLGRGKESNSAARLWWLYEFAARAEKHSAHNRGTLLDLMAGNVGLYHQMLRRGYLMASDRIRALVLDAASESGMTDSKNVLGQANKTMKRLNRKAGAVSLDVLSKPKLRTTVRGCLPLPLAEPGRQPRR